MNAERLKLRSYAIIPGLMVVDLACRQVSLSDSSKLWLWHGLWGGSGKDCYRRNFGSQLRIQSRRISKCKLGTVLSAFHMYHWIKPSGI